MSWEELLALGDEAQLHLKSTREQVPSACPRDGEPLRPVPNSQGGTALYCPFDFWRYPEDFFPETYPS